MRISDCSSDVCSSDLIGEMPPARRREPRLAANRQLLERFEAIGGEAGGDDGDVAAFAAQPRERRVGCRLHPFGAADARLKSAQIGRTHVYTPDTNAHLVFRILLTTTH